MILRSVIIPVLRIEAMSVFSAASRVLVRGIADAVEVPLVLRDEHGEVAFSALAFSYEYAAREVFGDESISTPSDVIVRQIAAAKAHVPKGRGGLWWPMPSLQGEQSGRPSAR